MGKLDKPALDALIAAGCPACAGTTLSFRAYVDGLVPLHGGEPVGKLKWVYDGEKFLDGIYEIACAGCKRELFASADCPRCHAAGALLAALSSTNAYPVPLECPACQSEEVRYIAFLPAKATYEGKRAEKARTSVELLDPGFHGYRVDCKTCGTVAELEGACPLCGAPGPIRERPDDD
jgi:hypothetical protein